MKLAKKLTCLAVAGVVAMGMAGCGSKTTTTEPVEVVTPEEEQEEVTEEEEVLEEEQEEATEEEEVLEEQEEVAEDKKEEKPEESKPEVKPETNKKPEADKKPETVKPEVKPEQTKPEVKPEESKPETKPEEVKPEVASKTATEVVAAMLNGFTSGENFPVLSGMDATMIADMYGIDTASLKSYEVKMPMMMTQATEIAVFEVKDSADIAAVKTGIQKRVDALLDQWKMYLPDQYELVQNNKVVTVGNYVAFVISDEANQIITNFQNAVK